MVFNVSAPGLASNNTKDSIITLLIDEQSLGAKEIFLRINKSKKVTYQGVFKDLQNLCKEGVLEKKLNKYSINPNWVKQLKSITERIEKSSLKPAGQKDNQVIEFNTYYAFTENMLNLFSSRMLIEPNGPNFGGGILKHMWWSLFFGDQNYEKFKVMGGAHDSYVVSPSNTAVDQWLKEYYLKAGFKGIMLNVDYKLENDIAVVGNYVIQIFYDKETEKMIDEFYSKNNKMSELMQQNFMEQLFSRKAQIRVIVTREPALAKILTDKILSYFKK